MRKVTWKILILGPSLWWRCVASRHFLFSGGGGMSRVVCVCHKLMRAQNDQKGEPEDAIKKFIGAEKDLGFIYPLPNKVRGEDIKTAVAELKNKINKLGNDDNA